MQLYLRQVLDCRETKVMHKLSQKLLVGVCLCSGIGLLSDSPLLAATVSEIPLNAVSVDFPAATIDPQNQVRAFSISVAALPEIDPNLRLTSFTAVVPNNDGSVSGDNFRLWSPTPAPGWEVFGFANSEASPGGYRFNAISIENGIAPGETLGGFTAQGSALSIVGKNLRVTSVSSTPVPEPASGLLGALSIGAVLGTSHLLKRRSKQLINN